MDEPGEAQSSVFSPTDAHKYVHRVSAPSDMKTLSFVSFSCSRPVNQAARMTMGGSLHCHVQVRCVTGLKPCTLSCKAVSLHTSQIACHLFLKICYLCPPQGPSLRADGGKLSFTSAQWSCSAAWPSEYHPMEAVAVFFIRSVLTDGCALCGCSGYRHRDALWGTRPLALHPYLR